MKNPVRQSIYFIHQINQKGEKRTEKTTYRLKETQEIHQLKAICGLGQILTLPKPTVQKKQNPL